MINNLNNVKLPSSKSIFYTVLVLILYYNIDFFVAVGTKIPQTRYDWSKVKVIDSCSGLKVIKATKLNLILKLPPTCKLNSSYSYLLENEEKYWFRYEYATKKYDTFRLFDVHWLTGMPKSYTKYNLKVVDISLRNKGKIKAVTLGDELICRGNAEFLRQELHKHLNWQFLGNRKDVLNFAYVGFPNISNEQLINAATNAPEALYYIIAFWPNSSYLDNYYSTVLSVKKTISQKGAKKIFWIVPKLSDKNANEKIQSFFEHQVKNKKNVIIWAEPIKGQLYLSKNQYEKIADSIARFFTK